MKRKYKITTAKNAVKKGLVKKGDKFTVEFTVHDIYPNQITCYTENGWYGFEGNIKIRIQIPEQKPIDFSKPNSILKSGDLIIKTTGYCKKDTMFSAYVLESTQFKYRIGHCSDEWLQNPVWQDITDTYNSNK